MFREFLFNMARKVPGKARPAFRQTTEVITTKASVGKFDLFYY
jgi:hypothetical protein